MGRLHRIIRLKRLLYIMIAVAVWTAGATAAAAAASFDAALNIVFEDGRIMFYKGAGDGLETGQTYSLIADGATIARVQLEKVESVYSVARVISYEKELREGGAYTFQPADETVTAEAAKPEKKDRKAKTKKEESEEEDEETLEVKEVAKTSKRRAKRTADEEETVEEAAGAEEEEGETTSRAKRKKVDKEAEEAEEEETTKKKESRRDKKEETPAPAPVSKPKEPAKKAGELTFHPGASSFGFLGLGMSGMNLIPTAEVVPMGEARLAYKYLKISGSDSIFGYNISLEGRSNGYYFAYGLNENLEIDVSSLEFSASTANETKTSALSVKYLFPLSRDRVESKVDVALMASHAKARTDFGTDDKMMLYGAAVDYMVSPKTVVHGIYAKTKYSDDLVAGSSNETTIGFGVSYLSDERMKIYGEYLKYSDDIIFKSLGLRYMYSKYLSLDASYMIYEEDITFVYGSSVYTDNYDAKAYQMGLNYTF